MTLEDVKAAATRVFATRDGEVLMNWLERSYYDCKINDTQLERQIGKRDVVWAIKQLLETKHVQIKTSTKK